MPCPVPPDGQQPEGAAIEDDSFNTFFTETGALTRDLCDLLYLTHRCLRRRGKVCPAMPHGRSRADLR